MQQEPPLSVLLIEDQPDTARMVQWLLTANAGIPIKVDWAASLSSGMERLATREHQAVLLDLNLPDSEGFATFAKVRQKAPDRAIIVMTGHEDHALAMEALRAGVDEYLIKSEVRDRFLAQRIRFAVERSRIRKHNSDGRIKNGRVISFLGAKGGCGVTTTLLNLGAALSRLGETAIAIDLAPDGIGIPLVLNHPPSSNIGMLLRGSPQSISREMVMSCLGDVGAGLQVLCGAPRTEGDPPISPDFTRALLSVVRGMADYVLVDLPPTTRFHIARAYSCTPQVTPPSIVEAAVRASAHTILVTEGNRMGLQAALTRTPDILSLMQSGDFGVVLVNKTAIGAPTLAEFSTKLGCCCRVLGVVPPTGELSSSEESTGLPVLDLPELAYSAALLELAHRIQPEMPAHAA